MEIALQFYKQYNKNYYNKIKEGIKNKNIIINWEIEKNLVDTENNKAYIKLYNKDVDVFILVHEFAHFIDRNSNPKLIPDAFDFLCEVYSFYMERQLEKWLDNKYEKLIQTRRNNRMYFEAKMLKAIEYELHYENLFKKRGRLTKEDVEEDKVRQIKNFDYDVHIGCVNYLMRYPLANILSEYLIKNHTIEKEQDITEICLNTNLYDILKTIKIEEEER